MPTEQRLEPVHRPLLRDEVYSRLRDAIVDGTLAPGEVLRDGDLAGWLGVSRTPVREALLRLGQAGLVHPTPGRSTIVATLDRREIRSAQSVVAAMHRLAVHESVALLTAIELPLALPSILAGLRNGFALSVTGAGPRLNWRACTRPGPMAALACASPVTS